MRLVSVSYNVTINSSDSTFAFIDDESRVYPKATHTAIIPAFFVAFTTSWLNPPRPSRWVFEAWLGRCDFGRHGAGAM